MDPDDEAFADLANLILVVGRLIRARTPDGPDVVAMTETERQVMRLDDLRPGCSPSDLAARGRLQRTNVSTALRALEAKGMVHRESAGGRGVAVSPTALAGENLRYLRQAWAHELAEVFDETPAAIRRCVATLARLEEALID